ncbi:MAG: C69 family dipeptidase [Bacteroidales bacterium]|nr:C69 family dipeptidase [Bacteroidales bacterium]MBN2697398.1 C69 family dipeptidase [Bacteroidales bacterium]
MKNRLAFAILILLAGFSESGKACTNFLVTPGASVNGSSMITYAADSHVLYGELYFRPSADYPAGTMMEVREWDTNKYLGKIPQISHTFSVIGNMNEHQVAIGETTYTGRTELRDTTGLIDYGSLMFITLQRARTAREAINIMGELVDRYGYYSTGESFSISDPHEVWIMDLIGKGTRMVTENGKTFNKYKGAVWVAIRIPDGYVSGHANQARIRQFPLNDSENCLYAPDVISFAREMGYYDGTDEEFSFSDTYAPLDFSGARFCEIRVWSFFKDVNSNMGQYFDYASGKDLENRMPLYIKPDRKLSARDLMNFMRDHLEDTGLDMRMDAGAGPFGLPYRWRPLSWEYDGKTYCNERATATQQTGFSFVAESRPDKPDIIGGIFWFSVDDAAFTTYVPMYCGMTRVPEAYAVGNGDLLTYSDHSAFWAFNFVSNFCYLRYNVMIEDVVKVQNELETKFLEEVPAIDAAAEAMYEVNPEMAREFITDYSVKMGNYTFRRYKELGQFLLVKYMDGNIKKEENGKFLRTGDGYPVNPDHPGYPESWKKMVVKDTGKKLLMPKEGAH